MYRLTCIYAACKIEENHVSAEELGKGISQDHQMILNYEMIVLQVWPCLYFASLFAGFFFFLICFVFNIILVIQSLDFDLIVYAPYRSVEGFINDMEVILRHFVYIVIFSCCQNDNKLLSFYLSLSFV